LAGVTPAAGYITHASALVLGLILGSAACSAAAAIRAKLDIDDALDVSSVHGLTGIIGSLYIGFCSSNGSCVLRIMNTIDVDNNLGVVLRGCLSFVQIFRSSKDHPVSISLLHLD
jgi:ammonia channel protein AmtB